MGLRSCAFRNREGAIGRSISSNTGRQALASALDIALAGWANSVIGVHMRALAQAAVHAVERAFHRHMHVLLVNLAIRASILGVADASSVLAPPSVAAIIRASLETAIFTTEPRLAPARAIQAQTVVSAVIQANRDLAIRALPIRAADASTIVALSVGQRARISAELDGAIKVGPRVRALAATIAAGTVS